MASRKLYSRRSQIWVETAIYTLIGLTLIAIILSVATPQIQKIKDKTVIEQTKQAFSTLDNEIIKIGDVAGNVRIVNFKLTKGRLDINYKENKITYVLENTKLKLSEPNKIDEKNPIIIREGDVLIKTFEYGNSYNIYLELEYNDLYSVVDKDGEDVKTLYATAQPYKIKIENKGFDEDKDKTELEISVV